MDTPNVTLAYTANQVTQDVSVVDTARNLLHDTDPHTAGDNPFPLGAPMVPMGAAFTKGDKPAREMLIVDFYSGNLEIADAANFAVMEEVILQEPSIGHTDPGAFDVAVSEDGLYAYVAHMTPGTFHPLLPPPYVWNPIGSVSVIRLLTDQHHGGVLVDIDRDPATTTPGAPAGMTRIEPPLDWKFVPLSIDDVAVFKPVWMYQVGDKWPGEYLFLSGVGPAEWEWVLPKCEPGLPCPPIWFNKKRPIEVAVVDLNPYKVTGITIINGNPVPQLGSNFAYRSFIKRIPIGIGGQFPSDQGLSFHVFQENRDMNAHIYAVNPAQSLATVIDFNTLDTVKDTNGNPILIPTGNLPTDVKVQKVEIQPTVFKNYAYITNAGDDTVTVLDTVTYTEISGSPIPMDNCQDIEHYPTSIDARSSGDWGYSSDFHSNTVSVFDLPNSSMPLPPSCQIAVGQAPIRIVVQPVVTLDDIAGPIKKEMTYADPVADFTEPPKQGVLINDWEHVQELQETNASPQAVLSNLDNFQKNMNKWVKTEALKRKLNDNLDLYRAVYLKDR